MLSSVSANGYSQENLGVSFEYGIIEGFQNPTYGVKIEHSSEVNGSFTCYYETPVVVVPVNQNGIRNHRASIKKILNILNQETTIQYDDYRRTFQNMVYYNVSGNTFDITNMKRIIYYRNFLGKGTAYGYGSSDNISVTESGNSKLKSNKYNGYGRDEFYTNMLYSRIDSNTGIAKSYTTFSYPYSGNYDVDSTDSYTTTKSVSSLESSTLNNSASNVTSTKKYKIFPLHNPYNYYLEQPDLQGITKLMSDTTYSSNVSQYNEYYYEKGEMINSGLPGLDGSFLIKSKRNRMQGISRLWTYSYTYQSGIINPLKSFEETDPFNNKTLTSYINFYEEDFTYKIASNTWSYQVYDKMCFYKIQSDSMQLRKDSSNNILSKKLFEYVGRHDSTIGYYGQLRREKVFNNYNFNDFIQTEYEYYRNDTSAAEIYHWDFYPNKNGNLKSITRPNGEQEKYFYHMVSVSEIYPGDTINLTDEEPYRRHLIKMKFNNGVVKDTNATMWDTRFPIRIDNYKINGAQVDTLSRIYKSYNIAGYPTRTIDQDLYVTEFKYQPIHRINSITLPGDFSTSPDSTFMRIDTHYIKTSLELKTKGWGNYNTSDGKVTYIETQNYSNLKSCDPFKMLINSSNNKYAFIKLDTSNKIYNFTSIDSAILQFSPICFSAANDGNPISNASFNTQIKGITFLNSYSTWQSCGYNAHNIIQSAEITTENTEINLDTINSNCPSSICYFRIQRFDVKNLINTFISNDWPLVGLTMHSYYTGIGTPPAGPSFNLNFTNCIETVNGNEDYWYSLYRPVLFIYGNLDISDTLRYPIVKGGTIKYKYDDVNKKIDVLSIRNTLTSDYSKIKYSVDGFGNIAQKDIYYDAENYNSYKYRFNYMNNPSGNFDPKNDSTLFSYDGLGRLTKTKNPDTSSTLNSYAYYNGMSTYFGTVNGLIEKQTFRDEEGNDFEKYFDAVGNLRREVKFIQEDPNQENLTSMITDYNYESLNRVTHVKSPEGKIISYTYDGYGRQSAKTTPDAGQTHYVYDNNNNLTYTQDANQRNENAFKYTFRNYDGLNRLTGIGENIFEIDAPSDGSQFVPDDDDFYLAVNVYDTLTSSIVQNLFFTPAGNTSPLYTKRNLAATAYRTRYTDDWNFKYYKYDKRGRVIKMWNIISGFDTLITEYQYNSQDQMTIYSHYNSAEAKTFRYSYDFAGRLNKVEYYIGWPDAPDPTYITLADYSYNENSQVSQQQLNDGGIKNNYYYDNRNRISELQEAGGLFGYTNTYYKNGNVKSQQFSGSYNDNFTNTTDLNSNYKYDKSNRLLETENNNQQYKDHFKLENKYDKDGNILELKRYDGAGSIMDNFNYAYYSNTNKLQRVTGSGTQYTYDANGNMLTDDINRNKDIKYDYRNLITQIRNKKIVIEDSLVYLTYYYYDEAGNRIRKKVYQYIGTQNPDSVETPDEEDIGDTPVIWELINDEIYSRGVDGKELAIYVNGNIKQTTIWGIGNEGYIDNSDYPNFYLKDHLSSIRIVTNENDEVISAQDYDCWGYLMEGRDYESEESVYKFTGKERDEENLYDYFGARYYDARIGRWGSVEPNLEKYFSFTPYSYAVLNPLVFRDINGKDAIAEIDEKNKKINLNITLNYSRYNRLNPFGLNDLQYNTLLEFQENAQNLWSGTFKINGVEYEVNTIVKLVLYESYTYAAIETQRNEGQNIVKNAQPNDFIEGDIGVGSSISVLFMRVGNELNPRWNTGAHEIGHLLGLPDITSTKSKSIMSYTIDRNPPGNKEFSNIFRRANLDFSISGPQFIGGYER